MATKINEQPKTLKEIIEQECNVRRFREINLEVFNHGVRFVANKITMYFRTQAEKYIIVLQGESGYLVNTEFELHHAEKEFLYLCLQDEAQKKSDGALLNFFTYVLYDKNMDLVADTRDSSFE